MSLRVTLRRRFNELFDPLFWPASRRRFLDVLAALPGSDTATILAVLDRYRGWGWYRNVAASQQPAELSQLIDTVRALAPRNILEIGTARGGTLLAWCRLASKRVISVDLPGGRHGGGYVAEREKLYDLFRHDRSGVRLRLVRDDSKSPHVRAEVEEFLEGEKLQVLFIDGDHTYEGVKRDFQLWSDLVEPGGLVVFHDIADHDGRFGVDVARFWREVREEFPHSEYVHDRDQGWAGIGVLRV